jgi:hypothetical protein
MSASVVGEDVCNALLCDGTVIYTAEGVRKGAVLFYSGNWTDAEESSRLIALKKGGKQRHAGRSVLWRKGPTNSPPLEIYRSLVSFIFGIKLHQSMSSSPNMELSNVAPHHPPLPLRASHSAPSVRSHENLYAVSSSWEGHGETQLGLRATKQVQWGYSDAEIVEWRTPKRKSLTLQ